MKSFLLVASLFFFSSLAFCQTKATVSGTIYDREMNGAPLLFADLQLKNTQFTAQTNLHGNFEFETVAPGEYILVVRFPGYETLEKPITVNKNTSLEIKEELYAKSIEIGAPMVSEANSGLQREVVANLEKK